MGLVIGSANGKRIGITGLGVNVPDRVFTNKDLEQYVDTTDEWIVERTGIRERRFATQDQALTDIARPRRARPSPRPAWKPRRSTS